MKFRIIVFSMIILWTTSVAFGQQPSATSAPSHKYRAILTPVGAGGGFALGVFIGISAFDDAVNSDRKAWTTALVSAGVGGVGGYFIGRALDRRHKKQSLTISPIMSAYTKGVAFGLRF